MGKKRKPEPEPEKTFASTAKAWLGLGPQRQLEPWEALFGSAVSGAIGAAIAWILFSGTIAIIVIVIALITGTYQEVRGRQRSS